MPHGHAVTVHDLKFAASPRCASMRRRPGVTLVASHQRRCEGAELVVSAVTASQAVPVAQACAPGIAKGAFFLDFNSASPGAKIRAAAS